MEHPSSPALAALIERAHQIAQQEGAVVLRVEPNIADDDPTFHEWIAAYQQLGFRPNRNSIHGRRSWMLDISPPTEQFFAQFRKTWRHNIHLAEREGVRVRPAVSEADFDSYYHLLQITSQRDVFFIHSKAYHQEIFHRFQKRGDAVVFLAELDDEPVAAKMPIRFGPCCWDMFGATTNKRPDLPKTHIIQYHYLQWAKAQGCTSFDFRTIPEVLEPGAEMWGVYHYEWGTTSPS